MRAATENIVLSLHTSETPLWLQGAVVAVIVRCVATVDKHEVRALYLFTTAEDADNRVEFHK